MTQDSLGQGAVWRASDGDQASPNPDLRDELLEAAEDALVWLRSCSAISQDERYDREADLRVRLRRAISKARRA